MLSARLLRTLGLERIELHLNSLGTPASRRVYREKLVEYFTGHKSKLDADSLRRLEGNPLRILDSKNPELQERDRRRAGTHGVPGRESRQHFAGLCRHLDAVGIKYVLDPRLVRGLDYYTHTVFEWLTTELGSQGAVCSGGRYDGSGHTAWRRDRPRRSAGRWARNAWCRCCARNGARHRRCAGRLLRDRGGAGRSRGLAFAERIRDALPAVRVETNCGGGSFKSQLKRADKSGAHLALILGDAETERRVVGLKSLRAEAPQVEIAWDRAADEIAARLGR
jgi:histidyl-tRNA synthetase